MGVKMKGNIAYLKGQVTLIDKKMERMIEQRKNIFKKIKKMERKAARDEKRSDTENVE